MLDKKRIQAIFLFEFKMGRKVALTTRNINSAFGPGTANEHIVQWCSKKFCKENKGLEDEEHSSQPLEVDNDQSRRSSKPILLQLHKKLPKNSMSTILWSYSIWSKLERWKSSISGCLMSWPKIKKNHDFEVLSSPILHNDNEPFLDWIVTCNEKWILYVNQWAKLAPKWGSWSLFGGLLPIWSTTAFWIPAKPFHLRSMLSKSMRCIRNCTAWVKRKDPILRTTNTSKVEHSGLQSFASSAIFTWPLTNWLPLLQASGQLFAVKIHPQPGGRKCFPRVAEFQSTGFYAIGINKLVSHCQKCVWCNGSHFD